MGTFCCLACSRRLIRPSQTPAPPPQLCWLRKAWERWSLDCSAVGSTVVFRSLVEGKEVCARGASPTSHQLMSEAESPSPIASRSASPAEGRKAGPVELMQITALLKCFWRWSSMRLCEAPAYQLRTRSSLLVPRLHTTEPSSLQQSAKVVSLSPLGT